MKKIIVMLACVMPMMCSCQNKSTQKTDLYIRYKKYVKAISLKCGRNNSMHCESIQDFKAYLEKIGIPYKIIDKYVCYHYGYLKDENNKTDYSKKLSSEEYKILYQNEIDIFNKQINKTKIIIDMIDRFIIRGKNSDYDIDALISGTIDNYIWILKYDIYDLFLENRKNDYTSPHIACLTIGVQLILYKYLPVLGPVRTQLSLCLPLLNGGKYFFLIQFQPFLGCNLRKNLYTLFHK